MTADNRYTVYRLAGQDILFDQPVAELQPYARGEKALQARLLPIPGKKTDREALIRATGWIGDGFSTVSAWREGDGYGLEIPGVGGFWLAKDGRTIGQAWIEAQSERGSWIEALLGPPLVLALARQGVWCLHASAMIYKERAVAFLGESGAGKSTLAGYLNGRAGWKRLVDDIFPVTWERQGPEARPHFPQLKLAGDQQPAGDCPEQIRVAAIYLLDRRPEIGVEALGPGQAALAIARHTVAARLFDRSLLEEHLTFCSQVAAAIPIRRLAYPHEKDLLPKIWKAVQADLG